MHMLLVIAGGIGLLGIFALFGKLWGGDIAGIVTAAKAFIVVWLLVSLTNMWIGIYRASYSVAEELPILLVVFAIPAIVAGSLIWQLPSRFQTQSTGETSQMSISLPLALQSAVNAINAADTDAFVSAFAADGSINDWGRVLKGHDGVRSWARSDAIGAGAQMTVLEATTTGDTTHIVFDWKSRVFNGRSEAYVSIVDGLIREFRIPAG